MLDKLKVASFFSGGKDSTYSIFVSIQQGYSVKCLLTLYPTSEDSMLFHFPNARIIKLQSETMDIPLIGNSIPQNNLESEIKYLDNLVKFAKDKYPFDGIVHGGISSNFQRKIFDEVCLKNDLLLFSPLWNIDQYSYMNQLLASNFVIILVGVSAMGLDASWLGTIIDNNNLKKLVQLSKKNGFNIAFEGGEAETLVIDCPIYKKKLEIVDFTNTWDGQRGIVKISDIILKNK
jgi:ABC transporter with metal-binding/Fe-S-binding domain ATP-binding protein